MKADTIVDVPPDVVECAKNCLDKAEGMLKHNGVKKHNALIRCLPGLLAASKGSISIDKSPLLTHFIYVVCQKDIEQLDQLSRATVKWVDTVIAEYYAGNFIYKWIINKRNKLDDKRNNYRPDIGHISDPLAQHIKWAPIKNTLYEQKLIKANPQRLELRPHYGFSMVLSLFCMTIIPYSIFNGLLTNTGGLSAWSIPLILLGIGFCLAGLYEYRSQSRAIVFDKTKGGLWWERRFFSVRSGKSRITSLLDIHAIQQLQYEKNSGESLEIYYQVNVVLKHGGRINIISRPSLLEIQQDVNKLAHFLNIPVWLDKNVYRT